MSRLYSVPSTNNLSIIRNTGWRQKFVPYNYDGSIYDCTNLASVEICIYRPGTYKSDALQGFYNPTILQNDETGVLLALDNDAIETMLGFWDFFQMPAYYAILGTYSGNKYVIAQGTVSYQHRQEV